MKKDPLFLAVAFTVAVPLGVATPHQHFRSAKPHYLIYLQSDHKLTFTHWLSKKNTSYLNHTCLLGWHWMQIKFLRWFSAALSQTTAHGGCVRYHEFDKQIFPSYLPCISLLSLTIQIFLGGCGYPSIFRWKWLATSNLNLTTVCGLGSPYFFGLPTQKCVQEFHL